MLTEEKLLNLMVKANSFKEGDLLVGGSMDDLERQDARLHIASLRLEQIASVTFVEDNISEALKVALDPYVASEIANMTLQDFKTVLLSLSCGAWVSRFRNGLSSEAIAAVVKLMTNEELSVVARSLYNSLPGDGIRIGSPGHFGSRIQPNSPGDDNDEILLSILEGLSYGCGDVILGLNPASDDVDTIIRLEDLLRGVKERLALPTRYCVLSDIVKQTSARMQTQVDVGFQSLAGTSKALAGMVGLDVEGLLDLARGFSGLYFETGQGSEVTNGAAQGVDMVTLESRSYGLARYVQRQTGAWVIVNDVAGFIGPEVFRTPDQLLRTCLEDIVMAKLHGLTMGLDVCSTFHMGIDPATLNHLTSQIVMQAAPAYLMAVAGNADPMLGYLTTSFREHPRLRKQIGKTMSTPMARRFEQLGILSGSGDLKPDRPGADSLYAIYMKSGGDSRSLGSLKEEARRKLTAIRERGFDLGYGHGEGYIAPDEVRNRLEGIYGQARQSLYANLDHDLMRQVSPGGLRVRSMAVDREDYLMHPAAGERIRDQDSDRVARLYVSSRMATVQVVISDGLNADAVHENVRRILPSLKRQMAASGHHVSDMDIVVENGRVRAGYHIGQLLDADVVVHLIGERPGTGLNTLSAYITYGRQPDGASRWSLDLDHSNTTAVCGIHRLGKPPEDAADEIARLVHRMIEQRRSGVALGRL